jgi:CubicO group peptidase (beta-lactamase class C family)
MVSGGRLPKDAIPVRWLLTHQAGLAALDRPVSRTELLSWAPVVRALEEQTPNWPPGSAHGYHSMTYGFLVGEVIHRVTGELPGSWVSGHVAGPLGAACYLGLPGALHGIPAPVLPFPAANGIGSAHGIARILAALVGEVDGIRLLSPTAVEEARRERVHGPDLAAFAMTETALGTGFNLPTRERSLGGPGSFGTVGLGGCRAWALPAVRKA